MPLRIFSDKHPRSQVCTLEADLLDNQLRYSLFDMLNSSPAEGPVQPAQEGSRQQINQSSLKAPKTWTEALRWVFSFPAVLIMLIVGTVYAQARHGLADPDIWWHLRNAEYLLTNHRFIHTDMYSFTVAGHPWVDPEWLAEVPYFLAWRAFGLMGIKVLSIVAIEVVFLGLLYLCWKESGKIKAAAVSTFFAVLLGTVTFGPRTILFGYAYLVALLILLERFRSQGKAPLWLVPPLFCLWINTHGSWSIGLIVFAIIIASGMIEGSWGKITAVRWPPAHLRKLLITFLASVAVLFVNPYGYRLVSYPFDMAFHQKLNISHVAEWVSVNFHDVRGKVALILIIALLLGALLKGRQWKLHELGLVLFGLYCGLTYIRFLMLAGILAAPLLSKFIDSVPPYRREIDKPVLNAAIIFSVLAFMACGSPSVSELQKSIGESYPTRVLPFLRSHPPDGPTLNFYLWGGYLGWEDRSFKCFIDSRVDIFEYAGVLKDYLDLLGLKKPEAILSKYRIRYVLFPLDEPLTFVLTRDPDWKLIYKDKVCVMFKREEGMGSAGN